MWIRVTPDVLALKREKFMTSIGDNGKIIKITALNIYIVIYYLYTTYTEHVFVYDLSLSILTAL